jgi:hypothetical protein
MVSRGTHPTGMGPSPPPSLAWNLQNALRRSLAPPSIFQPHDANVVKEPSTLRSSTQSPSNA